MERALLLAKNGEGRVSPNPMVGAVIVHDGTIIGEGFHAFFGGPHAEVNAINSVAEKDRHKLKDSTIYVTLEPCSHFGKTPPCANLIIKTGIPRVVVGSVDPNPLVAGNGVRLLREAGIEVVTGILSKENEALNKIFFKAHTSPLPYIILKWAQSSDGFIAVIDKEGNKKPYTISNPLSKVWMHRLRSTVDGILIGSNTEKIDRPLLTVRYWGGNSPKKLVAEKIEDLRKYLEDLRSEGFSSIMVEGGAKLLDSFIKERLFDEIRVEISPDILKNGVQAPTLPSDIRLTDKELCHQNLILTYMASTR